MAGDSVIGALRVVLGADTAALDKGLSDSGGKLQAFADVAKASLALAAASVAAASLAIGSAIKSAIDNADKVNKISQSTGTTTEEFTKLSYAAQLADVSQESLGKSLGKLSKAMVSAGTDVAGTAGQAFAAMGISVKNTDGTLKSSSDVLGEVAGKFEGYRDGAAKTDLAIRLFGKSGAELIPLLNLGKDGLEEAGNEAEKYGLVLDKKTTTAAEAFNDNLKKMDLIQQGVVASMTAKMLPAFEALSATILKSREESALWSTIGDGIASIMNKIVGAGMALITTWQRIFATAVDLKAAFSQLASGDFSGAWATVNKSAADTASAISDVSSQIRLLVAPTNLEKFWLGEATLVQGLNKEVQALAGQLGKVDAPAAAAAAATKNALQSFLDSQSKRTAAQEAEAATIGKSVGEQARLRLEYEAQAIALAKGIPLTADWAAKITAAGEAAGTAAMKIQGMNLIEQTGTPWDQRAQKVQQYTASMIAAGASTEQLSIMNMQVQFPNFTAATNAAMDFGANLDKLATSSVAQLSSTLTDVIMGTKSAGEAFAAFAKQVIAEVMKMIVQLLILKALKMALGMFSEGGPVGGTGLSLTNTGGLYASGGHVSGAGTGTSDSIPAMLSNGEFVINAEAARQIGMPMLNALNSGNMPTFGGGDISDMPQSPAAAPEGGGGVATMVMKGVMFSRDQMRDFAEYIRQMQRAGHSIDMKFA